MDPDDIIALFLRSQDLLTVEDGRVQLGALTFTDIETITRLCFLTETIAAAGNTPIEMALHRLSCTCAAAITTIVVEADDNVDIIAEWMSSRREYAALST